MTSRLSRGRSLFGVLAVTDEVYRARDGRQQRVDLVYI